MFKFLRILWIRNIAWRNQMQLEGAFTEKKGAPWKQGSPNSRCPRSEYRTVNIARKANRTTHKNFVKFRTGRTVQGLDSEPWYDHTRLNCNQLLEFSIELNDMSQTINVLKWAIILMAVVSILPHAEFGHKSIGPNHNNRGPNFIKKLQFPEF